MSRTIPLDALDALIRDIQALPLVTSVSRWTRPGDPGREKNRLYIQTRKFNGGTSWNRGVGYDGLHVDLLTGSIVLGTEAGARTRDALADTIDTIRRLAIASAASAVEQGAS